MFTETLQPILAKANLPQGFQIADDIPPYVIVSDGRHSRKQKLGKLLTSIGLSNEDVKEFVSEYRRSCGDLTVYRTELSQDYITAYQTDLYASGSSARSCMSNMDCVDVYGYDDNLRIFLVYFESKLVARTLVRLDNMAYVKVYLNTKLIKLESVLTLLSEHKFTESGDLEGICLERLEADQGGLVCPYLDGDANHVEDCGNYLEIGYSGISAASTEGVIMATRCSCCGDITPVDELSYIETGDIEVCSHCLAQDYFYCGETEQYLPDSEGVENKSTGETVSLEWAKSNLIETVDEEWYSLDDVVEIDEAEWYPVENCTELAQPWNNGYGEEYSWGHTDKDKLWYYQGSDNIAQGWYYEDQLAEIMDEAQRDIFRDMDDFTTNEETI